MSYELWQHEGTRPDASRQSAPSVNRITGVSSLWNGLGVAEWGREGGTHETENEKNDFSDLFQALIFQIRIIC